jgi:hypothetical protein
MGGQKESGVLGKSMLDGRQDGANPRVVRDVPFFILGHVKINAQQDFFTLDVQLIDTFESHRPPPPFREVNFRTQRSS